MIKLLPARLGGQEFFVVAVMAWVLLTGAAAEAAPANDNFANRITLSGAMVSTTGTSVSATKETGEPNHGGRTGGRSVWWSWTAPSAGAVRIVTLGSDFDTVLGVYTGTSVSALTSIAQGDDDLANATLTSAADFTAVAGTTYQIAVDGYQAASGNIVLNIKLTATTPPAAGVPLSKRGGIDIDGDNKSEMLQRSASGQLQAGRLVNGQMQFTSLTDPGSNFRVVGVADFDGNGRSDLALQNMSQGDKGDVVIWYNFDPLNTRILRQLKTSWDAQAVGDLDGDGLGDIVWRYMADDPRDTGVSYIWFTHPSQEPQVRKRGGAPLTWRLLGAADLNGDGAADMIYVSPDGAIRALMATGSRTCANFVVGTVPAGYTVLRLADYTGNRRGDILLRHATTGQVQLMTLNATGTTLPPPGANPDDPNASCTASTQTVSTSTGTLPVADPTWAFHASGDFNGDGIMDVIWRRPNGTLTLWQMNAGGAAPTVIDNIGSASAGFTVIQEAGVVTSGPTGPAAGAAAQTITFAGPGNITLLAGAVSLSASASSGLGVTFTSSTTTVCTVSGNTLTPIAAGTCTISANQAGNGSYSAAPTVSVSFLVSAQQAQTITFAAIANQLLGNAPVGLSASASSGLAVAFTSLTAPVCTVMGSVLTIVAVGTCTVAANQSGNASFAAAAQVTRSFTVSSSAGTPPTGKVAALTMIDVPDFNGAKTDTFGKFVATNDGVYMEIDAPTAPRKLIAKRTIGRGSVAGWLTASLPGAAGSFSVSSMAPEDPDAFGILWQSFDSATVTERYGYTNINNGGTQANYLDNLNISYFVPAGAKSSTGREWAVSSGAAYYRASGGGISTDSKDRFNPGIAVALSDIAAASHESDSILYGSNGSTLYRISSSGAIKPFDLSGYGSGFVHTLIAVHGRLWIGYGDNILRLDGDVVTRFAATGNGFATFALVPQFCISNLDLYTTGGQVYNGIDLPFGTFTPRSFLQSTSTGLTLEETMSVGSMTSALMGSGIYCGLTYEGYGPYLFTRGLDLSAGKQKLFMIQPL